MHHIGLIVFTTLVTYDCFGMYLGGWMLLMEVSNPFLNYFLYFRHRLGYGHWSIKASFCAFVALFAMFRLAALAYVTISFFRFLHESGDKHIASIPQWHISLMYAGLSAFVLLQVCWLASIMLKLVKVLGEKGVDRQAAGSDTLKGD